MATHTGQQSLVFGHLIAAVEQDVIAVFQNDCTLIPERIAKKGIGVSNLLSFLKEYFPLPSHVGSDIRLVIGQAEVEMAVRAGISCVCTTVVSKLGLVKEKWFLLPHLWLIAKIRVYHIPLLVDDIQ